MAPMGSGSLARWRRAWVTGCDALPRPPWAGLKTIDTRDLLYRISVAHAGGGWTARMIEGSGVLFVLAIAALTIGVIECMNMSC
jgi:hypothetical protein